MTTAERPDQSPETLSTPEPLSGKWELTRFRSVDDMRPYRRTPGAADAKIPHFINKNPDGQTEIMLPGTICGVLRHPSGESLSLSARCAWHIKRAHVGNGPSRFKPDVGIDALLTLLEKNLPEVPQFRADVARLEIEVGETIGADGVISREEMLRRGQLGEDDIRHLELIRKDVFDLNTHGTFRQKELFAAGFNQAFASKHMHLVVRRDPSMDSPKPQRGLLIPEFFTKPVERSTIMLVIRKRDSKSFGHHPILTAYPGRTIGTMPNNLRFWGGARFSGLPDDLSPAELYQRRDTGGELSEAHHRFLERYEYAQRQWYDQYGLVADKTERPIQSERRNSRVFR